MSDFKSDTCSIQLIDHQNRDVDLMALIIDEDGKPLYGQRSLCFYNHAEVNDVKVRVGEKTKACYARLTDKSEDFNKTNCELDWHIQSQIEWDARFKIILAIACFDYHHINEHRFFKDWTGFVRIVHKGKELSRFDISNLGDLSKTGCIEIGIANPIEKEYRFLRKPVATLPINGDVVKHSNSIAWLASHGMKGGIKG